MKLYKSLLLSTSILFFARDIFAQQQGQYSQYMMNYFLINPAVAGTEDYIDVKTGYRKQWTGVKDAPQNYYVSASLPLNKIGTEYTRDKQKKGHHSVGAIVSGQTLGLLTHNIALLNYAYHLPLSKKTVLALGVEAGANQLWADDSRADWGNNEGDNGALNVRQVNFDLGLGLWFYSDKLFLGLSSKQIPKTKKEISSNYDADQLLGMHAYLTGGYKFALNSDWSLIPSLLLKGTSTAYQIEVNSKLRYQNRFWFGGSYRRVDAFAAIIGVNVPLSRANPRSRSQASPILEIGYSYDYTTSRLSAASYGSHEIMLGLLIPKKGRMVCANEFW
jgi:type IX secretion system PorP/SprF family membrane protein